MNCYANCVLGNYVIRPSYNVCYNCPVGYAKDSRVEFSLAHAVFRRRYAGRRVGYVMCDGHEILVDTQQDSYETYTLPQ